MHLLGSLLVIITGYALSFVGTQGFAMVTTRMRQLHRITCRQQAKAAMYFAPVSMALWVLPFLVVYRNGLTQAAVWAFWSAVLIAVVYRTGWRRHRGHDEDCVYGPKWRDLRIKTKIKDLLARLKPGWKPAALPMPA